MHLQKGNSKPAGVHWCYVHFAGWKSVQLTAISVATAYCEQPPNARESAKSHMTARGFWIWLDRNDVINYLNCWCALIGILLRSGVDLACKELPQIIPYDTRTRLCGHLKRQYRWFWSWNAAMESTDSKEWCTVERVGRSCNGVVMDRGTNTTHNITCTHPFCVIVLQYTFKDSPWVWREGTMKPWHATIV